MSGIRQKKSIARPLLAASACALALAVSGCAHKELTTGSIRRDAPARTAGLSGSDLDAATDSLGKAYTSDTSNRTVAMRYASVLQMDGRTDQSLAVMRKLAIQYPKDREVLAAYGKALAANGELEAALDAVQRAQTPEYPDWKLLSAEGAILDQLGKTDEARDRYRKALVIQPNEPSVLSNLGMSYLLSGDLKTAETYMRQAAQGPAVDSRVRQNLALVVGLQGRFAEAEKIASAEMTPDQAKANVAYLRSMIAQQQNAWADLSKEDKATN